MSSAEDEPAAAPRTVVVGVDDSRPARRALRWAAVLSSALSARLVVVHAVGLLEGAGYAGAFQPQALVDELTGGLAQVVVEPGPPDQVLLPIAQRERADVVVVGHRGIGGAQRFLGSTSEAVVAASRVPVIVVP